MSAQPLRFRDCGKMLCAQNQTKPKGAARECAIPGSNARARTAVDGMHADANWSAPLHALVSYSSEKVKRGGDVKKWNGTDHVDGWTR